MTFWDWISISGNDTTFLALLIVVTIAVSIIGGVIGSAFRGRD